MLALPSMRLLTPALVAVSACVVPLLLAQRGDAPEAKLRPAAEQLATFHLPPGFEIQLVASEPEIQKPLNLAFDSAGRLWVTGSTLYPWPARRDALGQPIASFEKNWDDNSLAFRAAARPPQPAEHGTDTLRILSDFDPATGRARKVTVFADGLNIPIGILPLPRPPGAKGDSALVFSIPAIWRLTDTDGDGRADLREKLYDGFGFRDTHGMSSSYWLWFDGWVYGTHGYSNPSEVRDRQGRVTKLQSGNTYRFRPDGSEFQLYVHGQTNPFGLAFDARGDLYTADSHSKPVYLLIPRGYYEGISREHDGLGFAPAITTDDHGSSAIAGLAHYSAAHFPPEFRDNLFNGNPVTRRINRARLEWRGSTPQAARQPDFLTSDDPAFRPVQVKLGPDGALWIADFYNPIIGHYEVPLTHPSRDRTHGRIWRIVWRGLDPAERSHPLPTLPDLTRMNLTALAARMMDPNVALRSLAVSEFLARPDAASAVPMLLNTARLAVSVPTSAEETWLLASFLALERLGRSDDALLRRALSRPDSDVALAAIRTFTLSGRVTPADRALFARLATTTANHHLWRAIAALFTEHPQPWAGEILLSLLLAAPDHDTELTYALRLALKHHLTRLAPAAADFTALLDTTPKKARATAERHLAEISLAVATPAAAGFLLGHLERSKFSAPRAGEFARHAVLQLPPAQFDLVLPLMRSLASAPLAQRAALAEGLAQVSAKPDRTLPPEIDTWMRRELLAALDASDNAVALRAINAVKPLRLPEKAAPLHRIATHSKTREATRIAALRALDPAAPETEATFIAVLEQPAASTYLRRTAAELLGTATATPAARHALAATFAGAPAELALAAAHALAKNDAGARDLLELVAAGRVRAQLLRHRYLEQAFQQRPAELRARAAELTRSLPDEDARLDALIAQRLGAASAFKTDATRGAAVFAQHCATCHRFRNAGGNLGPSLDGSESRTVARLVEDILDPSRNIDPAFRLTTVTLKSGETRSGLNHREQAGQHFLVDPSTAQPISIPAADVAEVAPAALSPMPAAFETVLSAQDLFDVIAYLRSER